jgi:hypothetical protein
MSVEHSDSADKDRQDFARPVMEGKAVLFEKFAGIDCFDIEIRPERPRPSW